MKNFLKLFRPALKRRRFGRFLLLTAGATILYVLSLFGPWDLDLPVAGLVLALLIWDGFIVTEAALTSADTWTKNGKRFNDLAVWAITLGAMVLAVALMALYVAIILFVVTQLGWVELRP